MQIKFGAGVETAPGVYTREIDNAQSVPAGASTEAGFAGVFSWGPVNEPRLISSPNQLVATYGKPTNDNFETFFVADSFLAYADKLYINRVNDGGLSAVANTANVATMDAHVVNNAEDYLDKQGSFAATVEFIARYPGDLGNSLRVAACASAEQFSSSIDLAANTQFDGAQTAMTFSVGSNTAIITLANTAALTGNTPEPYASNVAAKFSVGDILTVGNTSIGTQDIKITAVGAPVISNTAGANTGRATITVSLEQPVKVADDYVTDTVLRSWEFKNAVDKAPTTTFSVLASGNTAAVDGCHIVVTDEDGKFTGRAGAILEVFENVSRATDAKTADGVDNYFAKVINNNSSYIWFGNTVAALPTALGSAVASVVSTTPYSRSLVGGTAGANESSATIAALGAGFSVYADKDLYPLSAVIVGKTRGGVAGEQLANFVIDNVATIRNEIVTFVSPARTTVVANDNPLAAVTAFRSNVRSTSHAALDSGYKYMYDRFNDTYRHVPLCGDAAGISARTDVVADPWTAPAGYNRGQIKNLVKLTWNPSGAEQKVLFANDVNPVVTTRGEGTFLMGDKTLVGYQTPLNQIGARKMMNILKTSISEAAKRMLFEFNDEFTQSRFRNLTEPFLRDVQGRRGIERYSVVCDDTNNTVQVKNSNQFVADISVTPARSIRTIHLNFILDNGVPAFTETLA